MKNNRFTKAQAINFIKRAVAAGCARKIQVLWDDGGSKCILIYLTFRREYLHEGKPCDSLRKGGHFILSFRRHTRRWSVSVSSTHWSGSGSDLPNYYGGAWDAGYALGQCALFNSSEDKKAAFQASISRACVAVANDFNAGKL